jgi:indole-3-glycerol phosphate synthase
VDRAVALGFDLIGVNSRDLHTFSVRTEVFFELVQSLPREVVTVAESGIRTAEDIARLRAAGYDAFLIGETLMRQPDPGATLAALLDREYSSDI